MHDVHFRVEGRVDACLPLPSDELAQILSSAILDWIDTAEIEYMSITLKVSMLDPKAGSLSLVGASQSLKRESLWILSRISE